MIDLGGAFGKRLFYTGGRSLEELMNDGEIMAIPDAESGIIYKRTEKCTPLEKQAALTVSEAKRITTEWNARIDNASTT